MHTSTCLMPQPIVLPTVLLCLPLVKAALHDEVSQPRLHQTEINENYYLWEYFTQCEQEGKVNASKELSAEDGSRVQKTASSTSQPGWRSAAISFLLCIRYTFPFYYFILKNNEMLKSASISKDKDNDAPKRRHHLTHLTRFLSQEVIIADI